MKRTIEISDVVYELYDHLLHFHLDRGYPEEIQTAVRKLYRKVLKQVREYEGKNNLDIVDVKRYIVEESETGKTNRVEIKDWECFMLNDFIIQYFGNLSGAFPDSVQKKIDELEEEVKKYLPPSDEFMEEDAEFMRLEQEIEFKEPNF